jgi:hypothetical protein
VVQKDLFQAIIYGIDLQVPSKPDFKEDERNTYRLDKHIRYFLQVKQEKITSIKRTSIKCNPFLVFSKVLKEAKLKLEIFFCQ